MNKNGLNCKLSTIIDELKQIDKRIGECMKIDIIGTDIIHKKYGKGKVVNQKDSKIDIEFSEHKKITFQIPIVFEFATCDNEKIIKCMKELKELENRKKELLEDIKINEQKSEEMNKNNENNKNNNLKNTTMIAVTTNNSFDEDCRLKLYYCKAEKIKRQCEYIGLYRDKSIRAIGKIKKVIEADTRNGKLNANLVYGEPIEETDLAKIEESISKSITLFNCDIGQRKHKYFIVEEFIKTNFVKVSNGGLMGNKYFDLYDILNVNVLPSAKEIAIILEDEVWQ